MESILHLSPNTDCQWKPNSSRRSCVTIAEKKVLRHRCIKQKKYKSWKLVISYCCLSHQRFVGGVEPQIIYCPGFYLHSRVHCFGAWRGMWSSLWNRAKYCPLHVVRWWRLRPACARFVQSGPFRIRPRDMWQSVRHVPISCFQRQASRVVKDDTWAGQISKTISTPTKGSWNRSRVKTAIVGFERFLCLVWYQCWPLCWLWKICGRSRKFLVTFGKCHAPIPRYI